MTELPFGEEELKCFNLQEACQRLKTIIFICGLSGAGRSTALDSLADQGFYINENIPVALCPSFLKYASENPARFARIALAPELETPEKVQLFSELLGRLSCPDSRIKLIFLDCRNDIILRRYGQTRRPHPFFDANIDFSLEDAICRERKKLTSLRDKANFLIDTSELNLHELRRDINAFISSLGSKNSALVRVNIITFGFKHGIPNDCDIITDVRFLPNPFFIPALRDKTGLDSEVKDFVLSKSASMEFLELSIKQFEFLIRQHAAAGRLYFNIGVGCTGGRHRSVVLAGELADKLRALLETDIFCLNLRQRDISKSQ